MKQLTLIAIAEATGLHKTSVMRRAEKEAWPFEEVTGRGGKKRLYPVAGLPSDVRQALQKDAIARALSLPDQELVFFKKQAQASCLEFCNINLIYAEFEKWLGGVVGITTK